MKSMYIIKYSSSKDFTSMKQIIVFVVIYLLSVTPSLAQIINGLDANVREEVKAYAKEKVDEFNGHLSFIASKKYGDAVKDVHIQQALMLFIGKGKASVDNMGNEIGAPIMQVSFKNRRTGEVRVRDRFLTDYLPAMKNLGYTDVSVTSSEATYISDLQKDGVDDDGNERYRAVLSYAQIFVGKRDGIVVYRDLTKKSIEVYITVKTYGDKKLYEILLGNIKVDATE